MKKSVLTLLVLFVLSSVCFSAPLMDYSKGKVSFDYMYRPNVDMEAGVSANATVGDLPLDIDSGTYSWSGSRSFDGSANLDAGVTVGLGNNLAVQYRQYNPKGTIYNGTLIGSHNGGNYLDLNAEGKIKSDEFNVLVKLNKKVAGFIGVVRADAGVRLGATAGIEGSTIGVQLPDMRSEEKNILHVGIVGSTRIAKKTDLYGLVSFGQDYRNWEAGLSYDVSKDLQFNVSYRDTKYNSLNYASAYVNPAAYTKKAMAESSDSLPSGSSGTVDLQDIRVKGVGFGLTYHF